MVAVEITDLIAAVRAALDELQLNPSLMAGVQDADSEDLDTIIRKKVVEAVAQVHYQADRTRVTPDATVVQSPSATAEGSVLVVDVPGTMHRFLSLKVTDSPYTIISLYEEGTPEALWQNDQYACGTWERPQAVLHRGSTTNKIRYYKLRTPLGDNEAAVSRVERLCYLDYPVIDTTDDTVDVCYLLQDAVVSMLTAMVLTVLKDPHSEQFYSLAKLQMCGV